MLVRPACLLPALPAVRLIGRSTNVPFPLIRPAALPQYKLGLESFNGSIVTLATDRFGGGSTFGKLGVLTGINQAMQVVGSIAIAPLMKRFPTRSVLSSAIIIFGLIVTLFLIIDAGTGGRIKATTSNNKVKYGSWNPDALFPVSRAAFRLLSVEDSS